MSRVILQVPMEKDLKLKAEKVARDEGFSSLQEIVRLLVNKVAKREIKVKIHQEEAIQLSPRAIRRYNKIIKEIEQGKGITKTKNLDELFMLLDK